MGGGLQLFNLEIDIASTKLASLFCGDFLESLGLFKGYYRIAKVLGLKKVPNDVFYGVVA